MDLVVGASEATMNSLLTKLGRLLAHEYSLIRGVRGDIQYINDEMASMQAFLGDLSAVPHRHDRRMKDWMKQIRDVSYDIEDCVDDFANRLSHDPGGDVICCAFVVSKVYEVFTWWPRREIASNIAELRVRAQEIGKRRNRYGVENPECSENSGGAAGGFEAAENQQTSLQLVGTKKPVGVDKVMDELGKWVSIIAEEVKAPAETETQQSQSLQNLSRDPSFQTHQSQRTPDEILEEAQPLQGPSGDPASQPHQSQTRNSGEILEEPAQSLKDFPRDAASQTKQSQRNYDEIVEEPAQPVQEPYRVPPFQTQQSQRSSDEILEEPAQHVQEPSRVPASQMKPKKQDPHRQRMLSIVGFGGLGKTTIATALYQKFGDQFERRAMVTVSQSSDITAIVRSILSQVMPQSEDGQEQQGSSGGSASEKKGLMAGIATIWGAFMPKGHQYHKTQGDIQTMKLEQLNEELKKHLEECSYLLLIDDVWSATTWDQIKKSLPLSEKDSRVIVTTRFQAVANACKRGQGDYVHKVVLLSDDKPEKLFMEAMDESKVSKDEENQNEIPPRLWEMCGGLPLAIVTMAGHVACNPHKSDKDWSKVCTTLVPDSVKYLAHDGITRILSHCYNDMSAEIKTCSLYLSIFPKGRRVSRKRLTRRWIAEGFVSEKQGLSVEDVAETYFNHLIRRKIIRPVEHSSNGKVKNYQVHDMILEYIVSKASEENFVTVIGGHWLTALPSSKVRRLSLQGGDSRRGNAMESMNLSHVRSLTVFESLNQLHSNSFKFGIVQVLDLEGCKDFKQHHTKEICRMLLLKYLSLRKTDIKKLPKKIGNLQYLETIDIRETDVTELPKTVCQLERVVNILGGNKRTRKALKLPEDLKKKTMKALRILSGIEIVEGPTAVADLHHLTDLRKLTIYKLNIVKGGKLFEDLSSSIEYLGGYSLHTLVIDDESSEFLKSLGVLSSPPKFLNALELSGKLFELPKWITELDALTKLTLSMTALSSNTLEQISQLKTLFSLTFSLTPAKQDAETATIIEENKAQSDGEILFPYGGFENLKLLRFSAPFVPLLRFPENATPKLERLELRFSILEWLYGIENLKALKELHLRVHDKAGEVIKLMVQYMATAAREDKGPRVIVDQYHE